MVSSMAGALCANTFVRGMSKAAAYAFLQAIIVVFTVALYFCAPTLLMLLFLLYAVQQFFTQMASPILWSMMAETADFGELVTGRRITGLTFSGALLALKLGAAVGGALLGWLLAYFGYQSKAISQSASAISGIVLLFTLIPALGHLTLIFVVRKYRLDSPRFDAIRHTME
jgi:GPH family glycoside/pentoside/hexuronide:cation symporter